ncbi:MAG: L-serine ammonia-lyase, iron-sulfur-dependent subunit beta [Coriobacteriia bacterium]|nr:L-serine ammonia-lyase, iron-sulfur-dependent subunit beta [Coriobacteriia bacterium]
MATTRSIFDILGPVMIGPSSSHTAGAVRLGLLARAIFGRQPDAAVITLHGSFASTGRGHGTDLAIVAGLLGMRPDDHEIVRAFQHAAEAGMAVRIVNGDLGAVHANTALLTLSVGETAVEIQGSSVGGGEVLITHIGRFEAYADGRMPLLIVEHADLPGEIASVTRIISASGANIAQMRVSRTRRGAEALMLIETDTPLPAATLAEIESLPGVMRLRAVPAV